ncbi:MAG TPA: DUF1080 domain-containing protein [Gemmataceae bacterium]|nr:DUF1080 domain-containing protein [Gemmataceae bacterium]
MHRLLSALLMLSLALSCRAADEAKPEMLTPKEIADGWILLFDGETTFGWKATNDSRWTIADGMLAPLAKTTGALVTTTAFNDYELSMEYQAKEDGPPAKRILISTDAQVRKAEDEMPLRVMGSGWHRVHLTVKGANIVEASVESKGLLGGGGTAWVRPQKTSAPASSHIALAGNGFVVRNIKLKPLGTKPLFNGKDLTGWKKFESEPKRAKSQFTVTKEGWLSIKNGPGDLQTIGQWSDFVLQLECRTNGDNLNSGIFFRCIPGEYQNGYEAQIQNRKAKEPKKYTIQEFDPKTHELKSKKTIENWSQDYGTGAIYRRIPARRSVAKDREWFTMTVVAHGRHIASWVNGIQVTSWTDNRPENENARNGCRLKKGPISLQGHDPTTDLNFRNIRLADLTEKK